MERGRPSAARPLVAMAAVLAAFMLCSQLMQALQQPHAASAPTERAPTRELLSSAVPSLVEAFLQAPLPRRNTNISEDAPLFFFHQRKTAGSSMRAAFVDAAVANNLTYFVACHGGVPCDLYHVGTNFSAIYAGHFLWGEQRELSRKSSFDPATGKWHNPRHNASCLTMFRDPIARLESCYYYRFVQERRIREDHYRCMSQLSPKELKNMYVNGRTIFGRGCLNEPFRILSGLTDELDLAALSSSPTTMGSSLTAAMTLTLSHLAGCVPVVLEDPRSMRLVRHWFPQLGPAFQELRQVRKTKAPRCPLSDRTRAVLQELSVGERALYEAVQRRVDIMLASLPPEDADEGIVSTE